ncbi:hypothetical protein CPU12_10840 [Malaciobacter molluscorum LMG 25693]|uniref:beta-lactamase n=1 Tax=Malaciobacter molluscorum LMG 25693 TaxID=870501 RepID=A0A2G1DG05_9BACT|nr:tetratricopeptide repeat protein [Malaciobacter molluscorum]AXX91698.1 tetratricopeptide repeat protein [Malaciobacter molluscorum LMG 25693]PHO17413.1 hypothetical protein CPU12_10840 [Malaciobacter molluscorum LMG 25693]
MKIKKVLKLLLVINIIFIFTGCNDTSDNEKKEVKYKASLPMPNTKGIREIGAISFLHQAKTDPSAATKIGYSYSEELKDYDKAIKWYKYSNSMKPTGVNSNYMCYAYQMKKDYDEAIKWCKNAIDLGNKEALDNIASLYYDKNNYEEAIKYYKELAKKYKSKKAMFNLGYIYKENIKNYKESEKWYKEAIKNNKLKAYKNLSNLYYEKLKDNVKASAYAIALINTKYSKESVIKILKERNFSNETIKKGYELQLNSDEFPIKYKGKLDLDE